MRRKFTDTLKSLPKEVRDRSPAQVGLAYCNKLFQLESDFAEQELSFQERYQARLEHSMPIVAYGVAAGILLESLGRSYGVRPLSLLMKNCLEAVPIGAKVV